MVFIMITPLFQGALNVFVTVFQNANSRVFFHP